MFTVTHQKSYCSYHYIIFLFCLGRANPEPFQQKLNTMYQHFESIGVRMSVKMHYLRSHVNLFQSDLKNISDQHGERFHQTIAIFEKRFSHSTSIANMLADFRGWMCLNCINQQSCTQFYTFIVLRFLCFLKQYVFTIKHTCH